MKNGSPIQNIRTILENKSVRKKEGKFVIEGPHLIEEALSDIEYIIYTKKHQVMIKAKEKGIPCYEISDKEYKKLSDVVTPQGIMAVVTSRDLSLQQISDKANSLIIACIDIQDPGNMGTIIRAADAANVSGIIASEGCVDIYNQKTIRSTAGSLFHIPVVQVDDIRDALVWLKSKNYKIVATDTAGICDYWEINYTENTVVLIGNEGAGLGQEILSTADSVVKVPLPGKAESLNAAICASVIMYEALRQRGING
ncbi:MAG: RNA methyltransferase [Candidatus Saganbacteria bacterium]|nr:RNA methyltransferase [Candidatus Saganbacteria bacterium]